MTKESQESDLHRFRMYFGLTLLQLMTALVLTGIIVTAILNYLF